MKAYSHKEIEEILNTYGDTIYRMAYAQIKNKALADDVYQEVCIKLLKQKRKIEPEEHLKAWLLRTTINCCKDYWKSAWVQKISWNTNAKESIETSEKSCTSIPHTAYATSRSRTASYRQ